MKKKLGTINKAYNEIIPKHKMESYAIINIMPALNFIS